MSTPAAITISLAIEALNEANTAYMAGAPGPIAHERNAEALRTAFYEFVQLTREVP